MGDDFQDFDNWRKKEKLEPMTSRQSFNRYVGLCAYAGGALVIGFLIWSVFDTWRTQGIGPIKQGIQSIALIGGFGLILLAIGFTTGRKPQKPS